MTDYILGKIKGKVWAGSISVNVNGFISATFNVTGKPVVKVTNLSIEELNEEFDYYMSSDFQVEEVVEKTKIERKKPTTKEGRKISTLDENISKEETKSDVEKKELVEEKVTPEAKEEKPKATEEVKKEIKKEVKPIDDDDDFNF